MLYGSPQVAKRELEGKNFYIPPPNKYKDAIEEGKIDVNVATNSTVITFSLERDYKLTTTASLQQVPHNCGSLLLMGFSYNKHPVLVDFLATNFASHCGFNVLQASINTGTNSTKTMNALAKGFVECGWQVGLMTSSSRHEYRDGMIYLLKEIPRNQMKRTGYC